MDTLKYHGSGALFIAHRGLSGLYPENTVAAFKAAAARKSYFGIETDVYATKDGRYVISHDVNTVRMTGEEHLIYETDFDTLRALRIFEKDGAHGNEKIPTLEEYIDACVEGDKYSILELKLHFTEEQLREIIDIIDKKGHLSKTIFISFFYDQCELVKKVSPSSHCQALISWDVGEEFFEDCKKKGIGIDTAYPYAQREGFIEKCHSYGLDVNVWTVDDLEICADVIRKGADFITTNIIEKAED